MFHRTNQVINHVTNQVTTLVTVQRPHVTEARNFNGFGTNFVGSPEPIYGAQYLPRKFKVGICSF